MKKLKKWSHFDSSKDKIDVHAYSITGVVDFLRLVGKKSTRDYITEHYKVSSPEDDYPNIKINSVQIFKYKKRKKDE
jgi:hypothetical protein